VSSARPISVNRRDLELGKRRPRHHAAGRRHRQRPGRQAVLHLGLRQESRLVRARHRHHRSQAIVLAGGLVERGTDRRIRIAARDGKTVECRSSWATRSWRTTKSSESRFF
jgi:cation diffusion facilitator CzcD-associated flavoprotein CzcO